jgi:hypothetical protein
MARRASSRAGGAANFYAATAEFFSTATDFCSLNIPSFIA